MANSRLSDSSLVSIETESRVYRAASQIKINLSGAACSRGSGGGSTSIDADSSGPHRCYHQQASHHRDVLQIHYLLSQSDYCLALVDGLIVPGNMKQERHRN